MGYESALQRVGELRALLGQDLVGSSRSAAAAPNGAFQAQLAQQQAMLAGGLAEPAAATPASAEGLPFLSVAQQYQLLGLGGMPGAGTIPGLPGTGGGNAVGQRMVALAQQELARGVSETSGNNESPRIREYRTATAGAENIPGPWCAYFVSWLAKEAGAPVGAGGNGTGYVPTLEAWGRQEGRYSSHGEGRPNPGDIVIINWGGNGIADHTGIVERVDPDGTVHTIEGNSSDALRRRSYGPDTDDIQGYVRVG